MMSNAAKNVDILAIDLDVLHNIFNSSITLFSNLAKFLAKFFNKTVLFVSSNDKNRCCVIIG